MRRILIARISALGDIVHSLPAVAALRRASPESQIGWIVDERWLPLLSATSAINGAQRSPARPLVDFIHIANMREWRKNPFSAATRRDFSALKQELRACDYEIAVDLQAAIRSALLNWMSRAPQRIGFAQPRESPAKIFYTSSVATPATHVVEQALQLAASMLRADGAQAKIADEVTAPGSAEFPLAHDPQAEAWATEKAIALRDKPFALINPGAGWGAKCWPAERYGLLAAALAREGLNVFVNSGPGEDEIAGKVSAASQGAAQAVSCSLAQLISLIRRARIFIGGDTGPVHLAAACGVPVVALYGPTDPARNGPYAPGGDFSRIVALRSPASRTSHARKSQTESGLLQISVQQALDAALGLLQKSKATERQP